jgi:DNA excision repair protein ERCC-3
MPSSNSALIVERDLTLLLDTRHPQFVAARAAILPFAELERDTAPFVVYRIAPLSLWSAAAAGMAADEILARLRAFDAEPLLDEVEARIRHLSGRWGRLRLSAAEGELRLVVDDPLLLEEIARHAGIAPLLGEERGPHARAVAPGDRGLLKQALIAAGWPADDIAGYLDGEPLAISLREEAVTLRDYQRAAAVAFYAGGAVRGGSGVVVLPPGAGKTIVGIAAMALVGQSTLILTNGRTSVGQWRRELLTRTTLQPAEIAEYTGGARGIAPVTIATYQMLTHRGADSRGYPHLRLFDERAWGLIIYDEVHLLPAPVFRATAAIQARRRLGLTATLVREDGREGDVFALIGPKKYEAPWREIEARGYIAPAACTEVRVGLSEEERLAYTLAEPRERQRIAAVNPRKIAVVRAICAAHPGAPALIIGQYLDQLSQIAAGLGAPLIAGRTPQQERERLFDAFRRREIGLLVLSKVGNFALDLPDAALLIQVSGAFGSRQEEAQRLGRVLRPKHGGGAHFYTLVSRDTVEVDFAHHRQIFLAERGYAYRVRDAEEL